MSRLAATLELDVADDQIQGRLITPAGHAHEFVGWLGLAHAIELLLTPESDHERPATEPQ
jgi:hypothetical protein